MSEDIVKLKRIVEGAILAAGEPLSVEKILSLFEDEEKPEKESVLQALTEIQEACEGRGFKLVEIASGWRFIVCDDIATWVNRLWEEKPQKYSRALLETLALIAYRQPITRGDIEDVRGVAVSSHIIKTLTEREWVKVVGHRDVPGRPSLYATTKQFLDYFNLKSLEELPTLGELKDIDSLNKALDFEGQPPVDENELAAINNDDDELEDTGEESGDSSVSGEDSERDEAAEGAVKEDDSEAEREAEAIESSSAGSEEQDESEANEEPDNEPSDEETDSELVEEQVDQENAEQQMTGEEISADEKSGEESVQDLSEDESGHALDDIDANDAEVESELDEPSSDDEGLTADNNNLEQNNVETNDFEKSNAENTDEGEEQVNEE